MKTILKTISIIIFISMFILSCSKNEHGGIDSKYTGTYKGDATIKTLSGVTMCTGTFNVNSDGSVKGNLFNENYKKSSTVSKSNLEKQSDNKYTAKQNLGGYIINYIFTFDGNNMSVNIEDINEGSTTEGTFIKE